MAETHKKPQKTLEERISDGQLAEQYLREGSLFNQILTEKENLLHRAWEKSAPNEIEEREKAYRLLWACKELRTDLQKMIDDAKILKQRYGATDD